jgi:hypothetical protein
MLFLTTFFDKNYLSRGLVLYHSLKEYTSDFELYILCLDDFTRVYFEENKKDFPEVRTLQLADIEENDADLAAAKSNRSKIEYYFTLSPCLPLYLLKKYNLPHICSLDADILFLNSPKALFDQLNDFSIVITPHKFSKEILHLSEFGLYNVSFQIFKNNETGLACLHKWKEECIEYCGDQYDKVNDRFADQKYLDKWLTLYSNEVFVLNDKISGIAPWNLNNYTIEKVGNKYFSDGEQMIFYHFHHFKIFNSSWASNGFIEYKAKHQKGIDALYLDYWDAIDSYNSKFAIVKEDSTRYKTSNRLLPKLLKEKVVYKRKNNTLEHKSFTYIPKFIRKLIIKIDA